ncbi:MAG: ABC transporter ATP-binding protein [Verrucomicrobia bacterium]|nr:ABC transporter ATP-binding protein [Verrucomicrobiota bacterium]
MNRNETLLSISGLTIHRDGVAILEDIEWSMRQGEHWVLLGANGSGKTSLLSALTGYLMPTSGEIEVLGKRFGRDDWRALRTRIGLVSSSIRQLMQDAEPALETVASGRWAMIDVWRPLSRAVRSQARLWLRRVECSSLEDRPWGVLSQGERQRVLIARALMARPRLLILDEPCAGLDPAAREHFLDFLDRMAKSRMGVPLVLVTHHVEEVMPCFTHGLVLRDGRVLKRGALRSVFQDEVLSKAFSVPVLLTKSRGRYAMRVGGNPRRMI